MSNKTELVIPEKNNKNFQLEASVRFESKISNDDLIEALTLEVEENLLNEKKKLHKEQNEIQRKLSEAEDAVNTATQSVTENYTNKVVDNFAKQLKSFSGAKKVNVSYSSYKNYNKKQKKYDFIIQAYVEDGNNEFEKNIKITYPSTVKKAEEKLLAADKELVKKQKDICKIQEKLNNFPRLKKKIKAQFVKTMLTSNAEDRKALFEKMRAEVLKAKL